MDQRAWAADNLAAQMLAEAWTLLAVTRTIDSVLWATKRRVRAALAVRVFALGEDTYPPAFPVLKAYLIGSEYFRPVQDQRTNVVLAPPRFAPIPPFGNLNIPGLATLGELVSWLGQSPEQTDWFSNEWRGRDGADRTPLQHYRYSFVAKRDGTFRLLEAPKPRLKALQRRILREILSAVPVHERAHGFVAGRSYLSGAQIHASEAVVATFDLAQFFPSIGLPRIHGLFRALGYPWEVARRLAGICTTVTPASVFLRLPAEHRPDWDVQALYRVPHLAQGAPTSPALANLLAWPLDRRLHGLARAAGANYTRYADDLAFSGGEDFARGLGRLQNSVARIAGEEGFSLNPHKTRIMPRSTRQRVTGIVVNAHCNVGRAEFDRLKAILHNCVRFGPASQNRAGLPDFRAYMEGKISWVGQINRDRATKLWLVFDRIDWTK